MIPIQKDKAAFWAFLGLLAAGALAGAASNDRHESTKESVEVRYARSLLRLAQLDLKQLEEEDQRVARVVPDMEVDRARMRVKVAEARLDRALAPSKEKKAGAQVRYAEERARLAEADLEDAKKVRQKRPDAISDLELEKLTVNAEMARLRVALWREADDLPSQLDQMQRQIDLLSDEVVETNKKIK